MARPDVIRDAAATLISLLQQGIPSAMVDPARITVATPDQFAALRDPAHPNITIFLYRITVNPQLRNAHRRNTGGGKSSRQLLPLELSFMVTPWASDAGDALLISGRILQIFYDRADLGIGDLSGSSWEAHDTMQLLLETLPIEDQYRLWDSGEIPFRLSHNYIARVVGIEPGVEIAQPPVIEARIGGGPS
jgi:hypothetical protein